MENTYWNRKGAMQTEYSRMLEASEQGTFEFTKAAENEFYRYYRYYNDGDLPGWARGYNDFTEYDWLWQGRKLNEKGMQMLEDRITSKVEKEWKRYCKKAAA